MTDVDLADRLRAAHARLESLRPAAEAGEPWPPSPHFGVEPEASWNPPELLAHLAEMFPYWIGQIDRILEGHPEPVSFGRVQSDEDRIAAIGRDRGLPVATLLARVADGVALAGARLRTMPPADLERRGTHPTLGEMTVRAVVERMLLTHLDGHVEQLASILDGPRNGT
jgi:hypothetical protein